MHKYFLAVGLFIAWLIIIVIFSVGAYNLAHNCICVFRKKNKTPRDIFFCIIAIPTTILFTYVAIFFIVAPFI